MMTCWKIAISQAMINVKYILQYDDDGDHEDDDWLSEVKKYFPGID